MLLCWLIRYRLCEFNQWCRTFSRPKRIFMLLDTKREASLTTSALLLNRMPANYKHYYMQNTFPKIMTDATLFSNYYVSHGWLKLIWMMSHWDFMFVLPFRIMCDTTKFPLIDVNMNFLFSVENIIRPSISANNDGADENKITQMVKTSAECRQILSGIMLLNNIIMARMESNNNPFSHTLAFLTCFCGINNKQRQKNYHMKWRMENKSMNYYNKYNVTLSHISRCWHLLE